ncbi:phospholipase D family protein [Undibacterium pigrum]|uniref:phospholipase D n=1 Tax=Undibacterium pigrum TaxID=401470 RepID=A0A318IVP0_9BURK|nr:phospholipase D family protein [Undibacterium pigrum]PXX40256.1 phospholipase D-like protein [Undibacterium pigrum]
MSFLSSKRLILAASLALLIAPSCHAASTEDKPAGTILEAASAQIENAFSPDAKAEELVLKVINTSTSSIRLAAYSFSSPTVVKALLDAKKRGVNIMVLVDYRRNQKKPNWTALNRLVAAGIATRTISVYAIHHDKYIIADEQTVQNGSFNYTRDAAEDNSENVIVFWRNPELAKSFLRHWESRWSAGVDYKTMPVTK